LLALAELEFAWRHPAETLSVLATLEHADPALAARTEVAALADAAALMAGRTQDRTRVFERPDLRDRSEARLWQGAAAALAGDYETAFPALEAGRAALQSYSPDFKVFFGLLAMRAAIEHQNPDAAQSYQGLVADNHPQREDAAMLEALTGLRLMATGQGDAARPHLHAAARSPALQPQVLARLALTRLDRSSGRLGAVEAAAELEQLYYSWEGDALQLDILEQLSENLVDLERYADAFAVIAAAQRQFPKDARAAKLAALARDLFRTLLTGDDSRTLDPLDAVTLFETHRDLMPSGPEAAAITRNLARRLAALDLIEQATAMCEEALRTAPDGVRPEIAAELADLHLAAGDAGGALRLLDMAGGISPTTAQQQRWTDTRVRALVQEGNDIAALTALGSGTGTDAVQRRADLYWRSGEWAMAAHGYLQAADELSATDAAAKRARLILRASAALLLAGESGELAILREKYGGGLADSPVAAVFDKVTAAGAGVEVLAQPDVSAEVVKLD
jgi:tetratricopeptide (TPR) repeat protein